MSVRSLFAVSSLALIALGAASESQALANRVFVSARSGNNANSCDNIATPCQTFAGAVLQLNSGGELIVLDSGGYGPVTITQPMTIEAAPGITAFIHPPSGDAITINATGLVTLRGLVLNGPGAGGGAGNGITVNSVGALNIENCFINGFFGAGLGAGIAMLTEDTMKITVKGTTITGCGRGIQVTPTAGTLRVSVDHCHLDHNVMGYYAASVSPGKSKVSAMSSTADGNSVGWQCGDLTNGEDVLLLEYCGISENDNGLIVKGQSNQTVGRYSNCVFADNGIAVTQSNLAVVQSRGSSSFSGNLSTTGGTIGSFSPM
jgi:hypothetical protein